MVSGLVTRLGNHATGSCVKRSREGASSFDLVTATDLSTYRVGMSRENQPDDTAQSVGEDPAYLTSAGERENDRAREDAERALTTWYSSNISFTAG